MNTRRKLLFFGKRGGAPGQSLFDAYKTRVESSPEFGTVQNNAETLKLFNEQVNISLRNNLILEIDSRAGNRLTSGNTDRSYSLDPNDNDISQVFASRQPAFTADGYLFDGTDDSLERAGILGQHTSANVWFQKKSNQSFRGLLAQFELSTDGSFGFFTSSDGQSITVGSTAVFSGILIPVNNNVWYMLSVDMDSATNIVRVYLNGTEVLEQSYTPMANPNSKFTVGRLRADANESNIWNGYIDAIKIWSDRSFPAQFYLDLFNSEKGNYGIS